MVAVSSSGTGVVGGRLNENLNSYEVRWVNKLGKQRKISVSIKKHGKKNAFSRACLIRQEKELERLEV